MAYRVELTDRAERDLRRLYRDIAAANSVLAAAWFNGLETAILGLSDIPHRCPPAPEDNRLRHLLYGRKGRTYRVIFRVTEDSRVVTVLHIRHWARAPLLPEA